MLSNDLNARRTRWPALVAILALINVLVLPALAQVEDEPLVEVVATDASAAEAGVETGLFTFTRTGDTAAGLDAEYTVTGTATAGSDYVTLSGLVSFAAGASTATVLVTPIDDSLVEGDETVVVTLDASADYAIGTADDAMVVIADNDEAPLPEVSVVATDASAAEAGVETGLFTFTRTGDTAAGLDAEYTVTGTATAGSDYVTLSGLVSFAAGASTATVLVTPIDDSLVEGDETVVVTLDASADYAIGTADDAMVVIADNDEADGGDGDNGLLDPQSMAFADCKRGGWAEFGVFKNQGDCVSFIATDGRNPPALLDSSEEEDE